MCFGLTVNKEKNWEINQLNIWEAFTNTNEKKFIKFLCSGIECKTCVNFTHTQVNFTHTLIKMCIKNLSLSFSYEWLAIDS
jgi:hypothetical protein